MKPILFQWGSLILPAWHTFYVFGAVAAYILLMALRKKLYPEVSKSSLANVYLSCYLGGYFGARIFSILNDQNIFNLIEIVKELLQLGPMTFYGGFIGAFLAGTIYVIRMKLPLWKMIDMGVPASLLGLAIGRIGCFLNGDDYGVPYINVAADQIPWWIVTFTNHENPIPRYPVQLMATFSILIFLGLILFFSKKIISKLGTGNLGLLSVVGYSLLRFCNEFYRGDPRGWVIADYLSTSQFISILALIACVIIFKIKPKLD